MLKNNKGQAEEIVGFLLLATVMFVGGCNLGGINKVEKKTIDNKDYVCYPFSVEYPNEPARCFEVGKKVIIKEQALEINNVKN